MAGERKEYVGGAVPTTITAGITAGSLSLTLADNTGWPTGAVGKFGVVIDRGLSSEEKMLGTNRTGSVVTITTGDRGEDGTAATAHSAGATVEHCLFASDIDEANAHLSNTSSSHTAAAIEAVASGGLSTTTVQAQLYELDNEKMTAAQVATAVSQGLATVGLLGVTQYYPVGYANTTSSATTFTDVDATNLAVSFTAPASGKVLVKMTAYCGTTLSPMEWGIREGTTNLPSTVAIASVDTQGTAAVSVLVTGVTAGSHTYKWAWRTTSGNMTLFIGGYGLGVSAVNGPAVIEVWAAP